ncbi:LamG domain-containing protein [Streptomyces durbertensis]|uniref:LamG domain-containing protein n=1 Tax=Streptomyces durbertensis TaxID=2448886 RepID=A0ABR6EG13_9ACTN|nr:LamG-like jellyroll fold domain-containing protein [Streptomyces durbertensis]MBB1243900.1 LamG domain-containing protein [Streptomyces durbertensis]
MGRRVRGSARTGALAVTLSAALAVGLMPAARAVPVEPQQPTETASEKTAAAAAATEAEALEQAKATGEPVEIASQRAESSEVFALPNGNLERREYLRPVRTRLGGKWRDVDTDLVKRDGVVAPKAATVGLEFSGGGKAPLVRMNRAGRQLELGWPGELPAPVIDGDTATYREVLPGVDLRMGAQPDGFTQILVVKSAEAAASDELTELRLKLDAEGLDVEETDEGGLAALDEGAGTAVFEAATPVMWDSSRGADTEPKASAKLSAPAARSLAQPKSTEQTERDEPGAGESGKLAPVGVKVRGERELVLTPDKEVLRGKDTEYPVFIDPQWYSPRASAWTMASKYWANSPQWKFNGDPDAGMGFCGWAYCQPEDTKRLFYRIPTSKFAGKSVLSAEFVVRNVHSASCEARGVQLWRTKDINSSTTWNSQNASGFWINQLASRSFAHGYTGCAAKDAEFNVKSAVQEAADKKWSTLTFGLRASSETDRYGWKRFSDKAFLRVQYNRPPSQIKMSQLTMEYGGTCKRPENPARVRSLGKIYANNVTDPDGDNVSVQFQAKWDNGDGKGLIARWKPARTTAKKSGSSFSISMPTSIPQNRTVHWYARSYDGAQYSPWSYAGDPTGCYFVYDTSVPKAPTISSGEYPASDPEDPQDPWHDGVGQYGRFTLKASDGDVTRYRYGFNGDPIAANQITTSGGAARTADLLPAKPGLNFVTAQAFDSAGNASEVRTYQFRVKSGQPERATWQFDEGSGASAAEGVTPAQYLGLHGGATAGVTGKRGKALHFDGNTGYAATDVPIVNTNLGFSVSAWVKLDRKPDGPAIVANQPGNHGPGFDLYYSSHFDRWVFNQYETDAPDAKIIRAMADKPGGVTAGKWTHLVGSYNSSAKTISLYVDAQLVGETPLPKAWDARRGFQLGAGLYGGEVKYFLPGAIDDVQLFDKRVTQNEVNKLYSHQQVGDPGRPAVATFALDEAAGAGRVAGHGDVLPAEYHGGVTTGVPGVAGKAARFNGTNGYAQIGRTSGPHVVTSRSFTVSAWAKLDRKPTGTAIVAAQSGQNGLGFGLYYSGHFDRWILNQYASDEPGAKVIRAMQPEGTTARAGEWVHLTGVHDKVAGTLTLYVNGRKAGDVALDGAFYADQSMYVGAARINGSMAGFFPGTIDDVRVFTRPVSDSEVQQLFKQRPVVKGRWMFESGTTSVPDESPEGQAMTLAGGARRVNNGFFGGGLELDGKTAYGSVPSVPVDTSGSFTVTAWAQAAALPTNGVALVGAEGTNQGAFTVRYIPDSSERTPGRWQLEVGDRDSNSATVVHAENGNFNDAREWTHLTVVYDGFAKEMRLYVDGQMEEFVCADDDADGDVDDSACRELVPWAENALTYKASRTLQVGRTKRAGSWGEYFPGVVDDVWVFQGALSDTQVERLAAEFFEIPTEVPNA